MAHRSKNNRKTDREPQDGVRPENSGKGSSLRAGPAGRGYPGIRAALAPFGVAVLSAILLSLAFPPLDVSWMAYVALVPLIVMSVRARTGRRVFLAAWVGGIVFFFLNMGWLVPVSVIGGVALYLYVGLYWAMFAWGVRRINAATRVPLALLAPIIWVALEFIRGWFLTGLPWIFVGHTQYKNLALIQTADLFGAYAQSFLVLMTAGLIADFLVRPLFVAAVPAAATPEGGRATSEAIARHRRPSLLLAVMIILVAGAWVGTVWYGLWRLDQRTARTGPVVASVQTCVPQDVKQAARQLRLKDIEKIEEDMLGTQCDLTKEAAKEAAARHLDLVVWPETMVPGIPNEDFLTADLGQRLKDPDMFNVFNYLQRRSQVYWKNIRETSREVKAPILFGGTTVILEDACRLTNGGFMPIGPRYNTAFLVGPNTRDYSAEATYAKAHLVPFGEYMPFKTSFPPLYNLLQYFSPYPFDYSLTPGDHDQKPMVIKYEGGEARFQVPICYEDAMPYRIREMVRPTGPGGRKAVDFLVNISNDGWFNRGLLTKDGPLEFLNTVLAGLPEKCLGWFSTYGSTELDQHLNLCVFRAVENRVPIVRSVNTGISAIISPVGQIEAAVHDKTGNRRWLTGEICGRLTLDDRVAPYTRLGDILALSCLAVSVALGVLTVVLVRRQRRAAV